MAEAFPALSYAEAERLGDALHDHLVRLTGSSPFARGDLGLADTVRFIARKIRAADSKEAGPCRT